jgi:hypothetical protein
VDVTRDWCPKVEQGFARGALCLSIINLGLTDQHSGQLPDFFLQLQLHKLGCLAVVMLGAMCHL